MMENQFARIAASILEVDRPIEDCEDLFALGLDSVKVVDFIFQLEDAFGIEFDLEVISVTDFQTISKAKKATLANNAKLP